MVNEKEIIKKRGIIFKPDNSPDPKGYHPAVIILQINNKNHTVYYLTLTSQMYHYTVNAGERLTQYCILLQGESKLPKPSLVNLDYIYKAENVNDLKLATLSKTTYQKIINDLKKRQDFLSHTKRGADEFYDEIKTSLHH